MPMFEGGEGTMNPLRIQRICIYYNIFDIILIIST